MKKLPAFCIALLSIGCYALSQDQLGAPEKAPLLLVQQIPLPNVGGRIDHFTFDAKRKRVIGAALGNNTVEVVTRLQVAIYTALQAPPILRAWFTWASSISSLSRMAQMESSESTMEILSNS